MKSDAFMGPQPYEIFVFNFEMCLFPGGAARSDCTLCGPGDEISTCSSPSGSQTKETERCLLAAQYRVMNSKLYINSISKGLDWYFTLTWHLPFGFKRCSRGWKPPGSVTGLWRQCKVDKRRYKTVFDNQPDCHPCPIHHRGRVFLLQHLEIKRAARETVREPH